MKITLSGRAFAFVNEQAVMDPAALKRLDGRVYADEAFTDYLLFSYLAENT